VRRRPLHELAIKFQTKTAIPLKYNGGKFDKYMYNL
jgi:hypothetical protein